MEVVSFTPLPLYPCGKNTRYPLCRSFGGFQSRSGRCGEENNLLLLAGIEPQFHYNPATDRPYTTELSQPAPPENHYVVNKPVTVFTLRQCAYHKLSKNAWYGNISDHIRIFTKESYLFKLALIRMRRRDRSVGTVMTYGLDDRGIEVKFPAGAKDFLFLTVFRLTLGSTQLST
jgi:hypothetical protein